MGRLAGGALGLLVALTLLPTAAAAQEETLPVLPGARATPGQQAQPRTCRQVLPSDFRRIVNTRSQEIVYFRDPVRFLCTGGVRLEADSAVVNRSASTVELIGRVVYEDSTRALNADWANYLGGMDQLLARGSVVLRDLEGGAVIEGNQLNYLRQTDLRRESHMTVTGGRPYAVIPPRADDEPARPRPELAPDLDLDVPAPEPVRPGRRAEADTADIPTQIWADRMDFRGEDIFEAEGNVDLRRGDMVGAGRSAVFDQRAARMTLVGGAFVESETYRLQGERIDALLEGEALREVHAADAARLTSAELIVRAERVRIGFDAGALQRLEAWNPEPAAATRRARADAEGFRLRADSIDAQADSIGIRELRAVGRAYGERDRAEEAGAPPADAVREQPVLPPGGGGHPAIARDWIQGDTIHGYFQHVPVAAGEEPTPDEGAVAEDADAEVVLERVVVIGGSGPALSLYRMAGDNGTDRPSINFMKANRIILFMAQGELERVEADGPIEGMFLEPAAAAAASQEQGQGGEEGGDGSR